VVHPTMADAYPTSGCGPNNIILLRGLAGSGGAAPAGLGQLPAPTPGTPV